VVSLAVGIAALTMLTAVILGVLAAAAWFAGQPDL
jgi:hypothetical protein